MSITRYLKVRLLFQYCISFWLDLELEKENQNVLCQKVTAHSLLVKGSFGTQLSELNRKTSAGKDYESGMNNICTMPASGIPVSEDCKDLLSKVLVGRPNKRYTIQQIQRHPWFLKDLPPGVIQMNNECLKLRNHSSGFQSDTEIQDIVMQAIGTTHVLDDNDCDDVIVSHCAIAYARLCHF